MNHPRFLSAALLTMLAFCGCARSDGELRQLAGTEPAHVRVVWTENPQSVAHIAWSTGEAGQVHKLFFDRSRRVINAVTRRARCLACGISRLTGDIAGHGLAQTSQQFARVAFSAV